MTNRTNRKLPPLDGWAIILGASSGFGAATARALAEAGVNIIGVHLDRRATQPNADQVAADVRAFGREAWFFNVNAADDDRRGEVLGEVQRRFAERGQGEQIRILLHSIAFGSLKPYVGEDVLNQKQMDMTLHVMAHSLVYWAQDLLRRQMLSNEGRIYAMTSTGATLAWEGYGAVSAAKGAIECHIRQLARELAKTGITANALCAGVTETAASVKIPGYDAMSAAALGKNPHDRLTRPEDVAAAIVALAQPATYWLNGSIVYLDGGEAHCG